MSNSVLVFCTQHMPTGGIESHLKEFCNRMTEAGVKVDLIILNSAMLPETEAFYRKVCRRVYLSKSKSAFSRALSLAAVALKFSGRRYNSLYTNGQGESIFLFSRLILRKGTWVHHHHTSGDRADQLTWGNQYNRSLRMADHVIACSKKNASDIRYAVVRDVKTIPCFSRDVSSNLIHQREKVSFGYYGRLIPEKGIDTLCSLSNDKDLADIEINIWGEGKAYPASFFTNYPSIKFHGSFMGEEELKQIVSRLDAYLLLSTHPEGLPIALLEVMSAGLPWLATDQGGIPDIACDPRTTRVIPKTAGYDEIKASILWLAKDVKTGRLNRNKQQELYSQNFSYKVLVNRWKDTLALS